jgi:hypothetical protein
MLAHRCVVVGIMLTALGGCVALSDGPERVITVNEQVSSVPEAAKSIAAVPMPSGNESFDKPVRNYYITERMYLIDLEFNPYFARLTTQNQAGNLAADTALITTTFLTTVLASPATKTALGAAATGIAGLRTDISQDVLLTHTIQLLLQQMETSRNHVRARIEGNLQACKTSEYTVWQALTDLEDYYRAGTLPGALEALAAATGNNNQQSKDVKNGQTQTSAPTTNSQSQTSQGGAVKTAAAPQGSNSSSGCQANTLITAAVAQARAAARSAADSAAAAAAAAKNQQK